MDISSKFKTIKRDGEETMYDEMRFNPNTVGTPIGKMPSEGNDLKQTLGISSVLIAVREKTNTASEGKELLTEMEETATKMVEDYTEEDVKRV